MSHFRIGAINLIVLKFRDTTLKIFLLLLFFDFFDFFSFSTEMGRKKELSATMKESIYEKNRNGLSYRAISGKI